MLLVGGGVGQVGYTAILSSLEDPHFHSSPRQDQPQQTGALASRITKNVSQSFCQRLTSVLTSLLIIFAMQAAMEYTSVNGISHNPSWCGSDSGPSETLTKGSHNLHRTRNKLTRNSSLYADDAAFHNFCLSNAYKEAQNSLLKSFEKFGLQAHLGTRHPNQPDKKIPN